jgi:hypothetical protein
METPWWEEPLAILCKWWWVLLLLLVLGLTAYFTRDFWLPMLLGVPPA